MSNNNAIILTHGLLDSNNGKTAHGLIRGSDRFNIIGVADFKTAGKDAGMVLDGIHRNIPIYKNIKDAIEKAGVPIHYCIIGVAVAGGKIPSDMLSELKVAIKSGINIINGLHEFLNEKPAFVRLAKKHGVSLTDVRKTKRANEMQYWTGRVAKVSTPKIAVLGMDCAIGKRTTSRFLLEECRKQGIKAEMISTGQTGWMQSGAYGFILDSTLNDFVTGELETEIVRCFEEKQPDVMFLNGQSALRNPIGPCGAEFLVSGRAKWVVLQAVPGRKLYKGTEKTLPVEIPSIKSEIELIKMYGAETIAVALNGEDLTAEELKAKQKELKATLGIPVILPLQDGVGEIIEIIKEKILKGDK